MRGWLLLAWTKGCGKPLPGPKACLDRPPDNAHATLEHPSTIPWRSFFASAPPPLLTLPCMQATLELVRTTAHGQRHECSKCGGVLSIVYDSQPDCIWPVAGAIDDESYPSASTAELSASLCRVVHICCSDLQSWIELPDDGLPRLKFAG